jgi:hypothetical protein
MLAPEFRPKRGSARLGGLMVIVIWLLIGGIVAGLAFS